MAGDFGRVATFGSPGDHPANETYRVNPAGKDQGRSTQERFQESFERRKRKPSDADDTPEAQQEDGADTGSAGLQEIEDRVNLSAQAAALEQKQPDLAESEEPAKPDPAIKPDVPDKPEGPDSGSGHVNVLA